MLSSWLSEDRVILDFEAKDKWDAIHRLAETLRGSQEIPDFSRFMEDLLNREQQQTTGVGGGIALPHARSDAVEKLIVAVGVTRSPLDFESVDGRPVNLIFLMGVPHESAVEYIKLLAHLTKTVCKADVVKRMLAASDASCLIEVLRDLEG